MLGYFSTVNSLPPSFVRCYIIGPNNPPISPPRPSGQCGYQQARGKKGEDLGALLRKEGIHEVDLRDWEMTIRGSLNKKGRKPTKNVAYEKRIKEPERELRRKEKALAETAALLVLKKKVDAIWGDGDDATGKKKEK